MPTDESEVKGLEPLQTELYNALKAKSEEVASMYLGAVQVFTLTTIPGRVTLAAHAIREMMGLLPKVIDVPVNDGARQRLGDFVTNLKEAWARMCKRNRWPGDPKWDGSIDSDLKKFLAQIEALLEADSRIKTDRRSVTQSFIRKQNFSLVGLPEEIEDLRVQEWMKFHDYFVITAHYNPTDESTFLKYLKHFEDLLLRYLEPRTFETQDEILEIIQEGESHAD